MSILVARDVEWTPNMRLMAVGGSVLGPMGVGLDVEEIYPEVKGSPHLMVWWVRLATGNLLELHLLRTEKVWVS